jgi:hypothetical protein
MAVMNRLTILIWEGVSLRKIYHVKVSSNSSTILSTKIELAFPVDILLQEECSLIS